MTQNDPETPKASTGTKAAKAPKAPPWVADPNLLAKVSEAAEAIGVGVEDLVNMIIDGGLVALPASDGFTERYDLKDLGTRLWGSMQQQPKSARATWFHRLAPAQKTAVIVVLREKGFPTQTIAQEFMIPPLEVTRTWNQHAGNIGEQVVEVRLNTIAGNLQIVAEKAQHGAMEKNDWATVWRIQKELTKVLQDIGIVDSAIRRIEVTHKFDEQKQRELDAMLELERKRQQRLEDIKTVEADVTDELPISEDYDASN